MLAQVDLGRCTPAVKAASDGLRRARRGIFSFPNLLYTKDIFAITSAIGWERMFSQLVFISFLFSLRVPPDAPQLRRAFADDPISEFVSQEEKALIGVRPLDKSVALVIKLSWRTNLEGGCILRRPCLCNHGSSIGIRIRPHAEFGLLSEAELNQGN